MYVCCLRDYKENSMEDTPLHRMYLLQTMNKMNTQFIQMPKN